MAQSKLINFLDDIFLLFGIYFGVKNNRWQNHKVADYSGYHNYGAQHAKVDSRYKSAQHQHPKADAEY